MTVSAFNFNQLNHVPFLRIVLPFIIGIVAANSFMIQNKVIIIATILLFFSSFILNTYSGYKVQWLWGFFTSLFIITTGMLCSNLNNNCINKNIFPEKTIEIEGYLEITPIKKEHSYQSIFVIQKTSTNNLIKKKVRILINLSIDTVANQLHAGDKIKIRTVIKRIQNYGNPGEFDYRRHMQIKRIYYYCFANRQHLKILNEKNTNIYTLSNNFRNKLILILRRHLHDNENFSVGSALLLGYKSELSDNTKEVFSNTGAQHILAVSGLHVGILYLILSYIFFPLKRISRTTFLIFILSALWFYAFITGLSTSVIRASIMFSLFSIKNTYNKNSNGLNILAFTAFVLLVFNPLYIYDIGFQLSFLAVGGIMLFYPVIYNWLEPPNFIINELWKITSISLAVQIGIFPFTIFYFHQFPVYQILTNFFIIYVATTIIISGFTFLILSATPLAYITGIILSKLLSLLMYILNLVHQLPGTSIQNLYIRPLVVLFLYLIILFSVLFFMYYQTKWLKCSISSIILMIFISTLYKINSGKKSNLIIYNDRNNNIIEFINNNSSVILYENQYSSEMEKLIIKNHALGNIKFQDLILKDTNNFCNYYMSYSNNGLIQFNNSYIFWLHNKKQISILNKSLFIDPDYIYISDNIYFDPEELQLPYKRIIISSSNSYKILDQWEAEKRKNPEKIHIMPNEGAFVKENNL